MSGPNGDSRFTRVERLEQRRTPRCPQCGNHPFRVSYIDAETDEVLKTNFPDDECPGCGRPVYRELHIVMDPAPGDDGAELA